MTKTFNKSRFLAFCLTLSVLLHVLTFYGWKIFRTYEFTAPVNTPSRVMVDLAGLATPAPLPAPPDVAADDNSGDDEEQAEPEEIPEAVSDKQHDIPPVKPVLQQPAPKPVAAAADSTVKRSPLTQPCPFNNGPKTLLEKSASFLAMKSEKLTYLVSMFGIPVGNAELESVNENGEVRITLRVASNAAISSVYPVNDLVETRHVAGRFIMTKIKQQEGAFRSDEIFTINLNKKRVYWYDNIKGRSLATVVPTTDVLDTLSGFYYLRNRPMQVGKNEILNIYDSETYAEVPVEIVRRETIQLANLQNVDTLMVRPLQKTAGIFRRTGDILIWMTDNRYKVPVKIVTTVALGTVTIELLTAESVPFDGEATKTE